MLHAVQQEMPPYFTGSQIERLSEEERQTETAVLAEIETFVTETLGPDRKHIPHVIDDSPSEAILGVV